MRIVLDTNVLLSGMASGSAPPGMLVDGWRRRDFALVTSRAQLLELERALAHPRVRSLVPRLAGHALVATMQQIAITVDGLPDLHHSPDPADNAILATALAGDAALIVSGDRKGMLELKEVEGIPILSPRAALERLIERGVMGGR